MPGVPQAGRVSTEGHLAWLRFGALTNEIAVNICVAVSVLDLSFHFYEINKSVILDQK